MVNHKRVYRLYREDGLSLRLKRPRRHVSAANRERQPAASAPNALWSMDFVSDALFDGLRLRTLTVVVAYTRESLAIEVDQGIKREQVVDVMTRLACMRGAPRTIRVDNGPSSSRKHSTAGPTSAASRSSSRDPASRPTTPSSNRSTGVCGMSASTHTGSCRWPTQRSRSSVAAGLQRESSSHCPGVVDASGICLGGGPKSCRMKPGSSHSGRTKKSGDRQP
jgi:hypothetical protein